MEQLFQIGSQLVTINIRGIPVRDEIAWICENRKQDPTVRSYAFRLKKGKVSPTSTGKLLDRHGRHPYRVVLIRAGSRPLDEMIIPGQTFQVDVCRVTLEEMESLVLELFPKHKKVQRQMYQRKSDAQKDPQWTARFRLIQDLTPYQPQFVII